jgi:hypothetical protein
MRSLAEQRYVTAEPDEQILRKLTERYFSQIESGKTVKCMFESLDDTTAGICRINELTLLICLGKKWELTDKDKKDVEVLREIVVKHLDKLGLYELKTSFPSIVDSHLTREVTLCCIASPSISDADVSESAMRQFVTSHQEDGGSTTRPVAIGPYQLKARQIELDDFRKMDSKELTTFDGLVFFASRAGYSQVELIDALELAKSTPKVSVLIVPSSDQELEFARAIENEHNVILCDSVSPKPSDLLLTAMAMCGFTDMYPELTRKRWRIESSIDKIVSAPTSTQSSVGHQAFIVVDKATGVADFTYFYQDDSKYLETSPNLVAAISSFNIDMANPQETSVFSVGGLKYAIVEKENTIFTLITGEETDAVEMRSRFSVLPHIYFEDIPGKMPESGNLYDFHPFVLKLLATLPAKPLSSRLCPLKKTEPDWTKFTSSLMREFLHTVWSNLDGRKTVEQLSADDGSKMTLGALLFLKRMGSIDFGLQVSKNDTPRIIREPDAETKSMYSHIQDILPILNGTVTIAELAQQVGVDENILMTVFSELYRRGVIDFNNE